MFEIKNESMKKKTLWIQLLINKSSRSPDSSTRDQVLTGWGLEKNDN